MLNPVLIDDPVRLRGMSAEWKGLLERSSTNELSVHPEWMLPWWDVFSDSGKRSLRSIAFFDGDRMVGLAPLLARPFAYRLGIPFRRLEVLASGEDEADESCSDYLGLIAERGSEAAVASAFATSLTSGGLGDWDELVIPSMNGESPLPALLRDELVRQRLHVSLEEVSTSPYVALPKTWDEYLASLKQSKRGQLRKALRALEQWAGGPPVLEFVRSPEQLAKGAAILLALHRERWATAGPPKVGDVGEGVYASVRYRAFQDSVMPRLLAIGALDLGWMSVRGEPVAAFYNLRHDGRILHYQSGRKLDIPDDVRAGVTMHALLIRAAIEEGMREYDFLAGASQYKLALANSTRPLVTLRAARPSLVESARRATEHATDQARRVRDYAKTAYAARRSPSAKPEGETSNGAEGEGAQAAPAPAKQPRIARALDERARAIYFGPRAADGRALFGWYHPPRGAERGKARKGRGRAIVLCPPLGYEGICAYPALRTFAERLSAAGYPVLRFDYDGTGDSGGLDSDSGRVRAWIDSVGDAAAELRALSGVDEVCLFGIRMGATLAVKAAAERGDIERLVLWNPCPTGKAYVREMKAFRLFAEQTGELAARPRAEGDASEESGGFLITAETIKGLKELDALKLTKRAAAKVLIIGRDDVPDDDKLARAIEALGATTTYCQLPGYAEMMVAPHKSVFPEDLYKAALAWLDEPKESPSEVPAPASTSTAEARGLVARGVREETIRFGPKGGFFGVLTEPVDESISRGKPLVIFSNTAGNYRIGPNRMYVEMGRKLAALGLRSIRIDVSGIGDSVIWEDEAQNHPYSDQLTDDVRTLIQHLKADGRADRFSVAGLCSGAFVAYHAAQADPSVVSIALINPQTFKWEEGMSLDVNPLTRRDASEYYKRRFFAKDAWLKMLKGGVNPRHALDAVRGRIVDTARAKIARAKAKLSSDASRGSEVARAFDAMGTRGVDVLIVFSGNDPGIDNLNEKVGASMGALTKRESFTVETIEGPDHSFTPLWSQADLDRVLVGHLARRLAGC